MRLPFVMHVPQDKLSGGGVGDVDGVLAVSGMKCWLWDGVNLNNFLSYYFSLCSSCVCTHTHLFCPIDWLVAYLNIDEYTVFMYVCLDNVLVS